MIPSFLKWAGGKRRIINEIDKQLSDKIDRYFEPFLGAGAVFFYVKEKYNPKYCLISDINEDLISAYIAVRDDLDELIRYLKCYQKNNSSEYYYRLRERFNKKQIKGAINRAAAFIYINKTCFNGLYRVNSKNEFNVPYGQRDDAIIFDKEVLLSASKALQGVEIKHQDYRGILNDVQAGDLVYLDPCYDPLKKTSFANYTKDRFCDADRQKLYEFIESLTEKKVKILLSNNDLKEIRDLYISEKGYEIFPVMVSRPINATVEGRGKIQELLIRNY